MRPASPDLKDLLREAEDGSEEATWQLVERFSPYLYRVVRRRMEPSLRRRFDSKDFVQMAWASFLLRDRNLTEFEDEQSLVAFLAAIAANKVAGGARATFARKKRDANREVGIDHPEASGVASVEPGPSHVVEFRDIWNRYLSEQPKHHQRIVQLRIDGLTHQAIADELALNERTVRRVLKNLCAEFDP